MDLKCVEHVEQKNQQGAFCTRGLTVVIRPTTAVNIHDTAVNFQEITDKSPVMPGDVRWHFIGHLQSNKVKALLEGCLNLAMLETVDSVKLANKLNNAVAACGRQPLHVLIQVSSHSGIRVAT